MVQAGVGGLGQSRPPEEPPGAGAFQLRSGSRWAAPKRCATAFFDGGRKASITREQASGTDTERTGRPQREANADGGPRSCAGATRQRWPRARLCCCFKRQRPPERRQPLARLARLRWGFSKRGGPAACRGGKEAGRPKGTAWSYAETGISA
ncbi:MAG: hypothetical protein J3K34DRAFT_441530 [Monoraphidium minutum]|nr:MAG: hypothetical protein J3K34DRAFT_441530 [Monoraphidium minutum]